MWHAGNSRAGFSTGLLAFFMAVVCAELFLTMGFGMLLDVVAGEAADEGPNVLFALVLANGLLLYLVSPASHLLPFVCCVVALGLAAYVASWVLLDRRYSDNLYGD